MVNWPVPAVTPCGWVMDGEKPVIARLPTPGLTVWLNVCATDGAKPASVSTPVPGFTLVVMFCDTVGAKLAMVRMPTPGLTACGCAMDGAKPVTDSVPVAGETAIGCAINGANPVMDNAAVPGVTDWLALWATVGARPVSVRTPVSGVTALPPVAGATTHRRRTGPLNSCHGLSASACCSESDNVRLHPAARTMPPEDQADPPAPLWPPTRVLPVGWRWVPPAVLAVLAPFWNTAMLLPATEAPITKPAASLPADMAVAVAK